LVNAPFVAYHYYKASVRFINTQNLFWMENVEFQWWVMNHSFTLYELWFRFIFLCLAFANVSFFVFRLRKIPFKDWSLTQKWLATLSFTLMLYDNPFFPLTILVNSWLPNFLDTCFLATHLCVLLFFWLCVFDGIRKPKIQRTFIVFYLPKIVLLSIFWLAAVVAWTWESVQKLDNPNYSLADQVSGFIFFKVAVLILLIIYLLWIFYAILRAAADQEVVPFLHIQLKFLGGITFFSIAVMALGVVLGAVGAIDATAVQFLSFYALNNLYVGVLTFVYLPSFGAPPHTKDTAGMQRQVDDDEAPSGGFAQEDPADGEPVPEDLPEPDEPEEEPV